MRNNTLQDGQDFMLANIMYFQQEHALAIFEIKILAFRLKY